ncbi:hypothetical protein [Halorubrum sp. Boch-26]|nr:hypothetical protein [Halorubrum sp. Boch-26]
MTDGCHEASGSIDPRIRGPVAVRAAPSRRSASTVERRGDGTA